MATLKKSELKHFLTQSIFTLKKTFDHSTYSYFVLATLFLFHIEKSPKYSSAHSAANTSIFQAKRGRRDEIFQAIIEFETIFPSLRDVILPAIPSIGLIDSDLIEYGVQLSQLQEKTGVFSSERRFSEAFDYWITQLAKLTTKQGVSFYTPRSVIRLMVGLTKPSANMSVYDPTAGTGGMFTESAYYIARQGGGIHSTEFYGCETAPDIWAICKMNMLAHGLDNAFIDQQDALLNETVADRFDLVLQSMPLARDLANKGQTRRQHEAFLRHSLEALHSLGRGAIVTPSLVIQEDHREFWRYVVERDWLEAVISLPAKLLHGTHSAAYLFVFNKQKPEAHKGSVLFIQAVNKPLPNKYHNELEDHDIQAAIEAFDAWKQAADYCNVISNSQIESFDYRLSVDKYLYLQAEAPTQDLSAAIKRYQTAVQEREASIARLMKRLEDLQ